MKPPLASATTGRPSTDTTAAGIGARVPASTTTPLTVVVEVCPKAETANNRVI